MAAATPSGRLPSSHEPLTLRMSLMLGKLAERLAAQIDEAVSNPSAFMKGLERGLQSRG